MCKFCLSEFICTVLVFRHITHVLGPRHVRDKENARNKDDKTDDLKSMCDPEYVQLLYMEIFIYLYIFIYTYE